MVAQRRGRRRGGCCRLSLVIAVLVFVLVVVVMGTTAVAIRAVVVARRNGMASPAGVMRNLHFDGAVAFSQKTACPKNDSSERHLDPEV